MKKFSLVALAVLLAGSTVISYQVAAKVNEIPVHESKEENKEEKEMTNIMKLSGTIKQIQKDGQKWALTVENEEGILTVLIVDAHTYLFNSKTTKQMDQSKLEIGTVLETYYDKNKPRILIYPQQVTPKFIIIKDKETEGEIKVGQFDKKLLSLDGQLKLEIGKETVMENQLGETIKKEDLAGKDLIVFYTITTRSLPPQTTPTKVIAYDETAEKMARIDKIIKNDHIVKTGVKMIPLQKVAEELGYIVEHDSNAKSVLIRKQNLIYTIKLEDKIYSLNHSTLNFKIAPCMENEKTYVEENFLKHLLENK